MSNDRSLSTRSICRRALCGLLFAQIAIFPDAVTANIVADSTEASVGPARHALPSQPRKLEVAWTVQVGTGDYDDAKELAYNEQTNSIVVSGGTAGELMDNSAGGRDIWFAELALPDGAQLASGQFGTSDNEYVNALDVDANGRTMLVGQVSRVAAGRSNDYWGHVLGVGFADLVSFVDGTSAYEAATAVAALDDAYVVGGMTTGALDPAVMPSANDIFLRRYDEEDDEPSWTRQFSIDHSDQVTAMTADSSGAVYVAGFTSPRDFNLVGSRAWTVRYTADGEEVDRAFLAVPIQTPTDALVTHRSTALAVSESTLYIAGESTVDVLDQPLVRTGWLARFDGSLDNPAWIQLIPGSVQVAVTDMAFDPVSAQIYLVGRGEPDGTSGSGASWLAAYTQSGERQWVQQLGDATTGVEAIAVDAAGDLYVAGIVSSDLDGDGPAVHHGGTDAFVQKLAEPLPEYLAEVFGADWQIDGVTVGAGQSAAVGPGSIFERECSTADVSTAGPTVGCWGPSVDIAAKCDFAIRHWAVVAHTRFHTEWLIDVEQGREFLWRLHAILLYCADAEVNAATVVPQPSLELELSEGTLEFSTTDKPLFVLIVTDAASVAGSAPASFAVGHNPESGLTGITNYGGELYIVPTGDGLSPITLQAGQALTLTQQAVGDITLIDRTFLPLIRR